MAENQKDPEQQEAVLHGSTMDLFRNITEWCECSEPGYCRRWRRQMVGRLWELCSGHCPPGRPCSHADSEAYREIQAQVALGIQPEQLVHLNPILPPRRRALCAWLGGPTGDVRPCATCAGDVREKMYGCRQPEHAAEPVTTIKGCRECRDYVPTYGRWEGAEGTSGERVHPDMGLRSALEYLDLPPITDPGFDRRAWSGWPVVAAAHRIGFAAAVAGAPPYPGGRGRGIVTCAGGWRFFPSLYVTVRMVRHVGCQLPIQVWYLGPEEFHPHMRALLEPWGPVAWIDAVAYCREHGIKRRCLGGWEAKALAVRECGFAEVLFLDADCYPCRDPEYVFEEAAYRDRGAVFCTDNGGPPKRGQWRRFGLPARQDLAFESGQFVVDRARCWPALVGTDWLNDHSDYVYQHVYGDKDTFLFAWRRAGLDYLMTPPPTMVGGAFLQRDPTGQVLWVHRTGNKFRFGDPHYQTSQPGGGTQRVDRLPLEREAWRAFRRLDEAMHPQKFFGFREGTWDMHIWKDVVAGNEYRLPPRFAAGDVVLDVGAHVGSFAWACLERGAARVLAVEPAAESHALLARNLEPYRERVTLYRAAAWRSDVPPHTLRLGPPDTAGNTGGRSVVRGEEGEEVQALRFDDLVLAATENGQRRLRLVKLDCEGSEWPILATSHTLHLVDEILGEYHELAGHVAAELAGLLGPHGFQVEMIPTPGTNLGHFWARRPAAA